MKNTKERITQEALKLFAENGYKGTSVKQIADAVEIKDSSLYKHYKSKQEIFDSIVKLIHKHMSDLSDKLGLHEERDSDNFYKSLDGEKIKHITKEAFIFYLTDPYMVSFWRIAHMEQYANIKIYCMFRQIFLDDAIHYLAEIFQRMMDGGVLVKADAQVVAINFYAPFFMLLTKYENQMDRLEEAVETIENQIDEFVRMYKIS